MARAVPSADAVPVSRLRQWRATVGNDDLAAWSAVAAFACYVAIALAGGGGRALTLTFPLGCAIVALFAYVRSPATYVGFVFWLWLLTPFVRRVFDLRFGYHPASLLLAGPVLATAVAGFTLLRRAKSLRSTAFIPFVLALLALMYSYAVGLIRNPVVASTYDLLNWGGPLLFGLHLALEWRQFPRMRSVLTKVALWGVLVTCVYGLWQFADPPTWDRVWVVNAEMFSVGVPVPFLIRVFSTMNAPGPFAAFLVFAVLIGLPAPQRWKFVALALGLTVLLLTKTRSAWGAFLVGALLLQIRQPLRALPRQWIALAVVLLLAAPAITHPRVMKAVAGRAATLSSMDEDRSLRERTQITAYVVGRLKRNVAGDGLGQLGGAGKLSATRGSNVAATGLDSGPLEVFSVMGWIGGALFSLALLCTLVPIVRERRANRDPVANGAAAAVAALFALSFFGNVFNNVSGMMFWSAVGLATAGRTYTLAVELARRYSSQPGTPLHPALARLYPAA